MEADVRGPAKAVFLVMAYHADAKFFDCHLSHELLAKESGFAVATVKRAIAHLVDLGLVATYSRGFKVALRYEIFPRHDRSERAIGDSSESPRDSSERIATIGQSELQNRVSEPGLKEPGEGGSARARNPPLSSPSSKGVRTRTRKDPDPATPKQLTLIRSLCRELSHDEPDPPPVSFEDASDIIDELMGEKKELAAIQKEPQGMRALQDWAGYDEVTEVDVTPHKGVQEKEARARRRAKMRVYRDWTMDAMIPGCCTKALEGWPPAAVWQHRTAHDRTGPTLSVHNATSS